MRFTAIQIQTLEDSKSLSIYHIKRPWIFSFVFSSRCVCLTMCRTVPSRDSTCSLLYAHVQCDVISYKRTCACIV